MAKAVFRSGELSILPDRVVLDPPPSGFEITRTSGQEEEETQAEAAPEVYTGPTADDLRREAEEFKSRWEIERENMMEAAKNEAEAVILKARENASRELHRIEEEADELKNKARGEAEKIIEEAKQQALDIETETRRNIEEERKDAMEKSREEGRVEGYADGKTEVDRLIQRTQIVLERAQDKRGDILAETEQQIIDLVLLISRKVVKVISDSQRSVIVSNVIQALRKVRDRGNVIIRVNLSDVKLTTEHTKDFIQMLEGVKSIQVQEDSSVDSGGCIIETDFGEIDARISSQLAELEAKILEISPIKSKIKEKKT